MLEGDLEDFALPDILNLLASTGKTGRLRVVTDAARGRVDLVQGQLRDASADADRLPLARRLLGRRLLDRADVQALLGDAEVLPTDLQLARALVARDAGCVHAIGEVMREQTLDAVFDLLRWNVGTFRFDADVEIGADDTPPVLNLTVEAALTEAQRLLADQALLSRFEATLGGDAPQRPPTATAALTDVPSSGLPATAVVAPDVPAPDVPVPDVPAPEAGPLGAVVHDFAAAPEPSAAEGEVVATAASADPGTGSRVSAGAGSRRAGVRGGRLQQNPPVDAALVSRLINGVEAL